jgi:thiol-disulfide isomerase/thioredoxin
MKNIFYLLLVAVLAFSCIKEGGDGADLKAGDMIPDFQVTMNDGVEVSATYLREGVSVIVFFATVCPDCRRTLPELQKVYEEYFPKGVKFAFISRAEGADVVGKYWKDNGYVMPYSPQDDRDIYELFADSGIPRVYVCKGGVIKSVFSDNPVPTYKDAESVLDQLLN